jgi:hypothetical protein
MGIACPTTLCTREVTTAELTGEGISAAPPSLKEQKNDVCP